MYQHMSSVALSLATPETSFFSVEAPRQRRRCRGYLTPGRIVRMIALAIRDTRTETGSRKAIAVEMFTSIGPPLAALEVIACIPRKPATCRAWALVLTFCPNRRLNVNTTVMLTILERETRLVSRDHRLPVRTAEFTQRSKLNDETRVPTHKLAPRPSARSGH